MPVGKRGTVADRQVDAGGPALDSIQAIPTLSGWGLRILALLVALLAIHAAGVSRRNV